MPALDSRRIADVLAGAARLAFERMRMDPMDADPDNLKRNVGTFSNELVLSLLASLNEIDATDALPVDLQKPAAHAYIDANFAAALIRSDVDRPLVKLLPSGLDWMAPLRAMLSSERVARTMLRIPPPPLPNKFDDVVAQPSEPSETVVAGLNAPASGLSKQISELGDQLSAIRKLVTPPTAPLFSKAKEDYLELMVGARGEEDENVGYYTNVTLTLIAICGDRPVNQYSETDLQNFVNQLAFLPPNFSKGVKGEKGPRPDFTQVKTFIEENKKKQGRGLALGTIMDNYLGRAFTIIGFGCRCVGVPLRIDKSKIIKPNRAARRKVKRPLDYPSMDKVIAAGVQTGLLADALLPALGLLTGRRISLLAFLRRESIIQVNGVWMVFPNSHHEVDGEWVTVPYKTEDSLQGYVLNPLFEDIGFTDWARRKPGFVFEHLMSAKDPGDAAQKRMSRLFQNNGLDSAMATFHLLRHTKIGHDRSVAVPARLIRVQAGHELGDVHDAIYGGLQPAELRQMRDVPLPQGIDWSVLKKIDFEAFAKKRPTWGRPKGALGKKRSSE